MKNKELCITNDDLCSYTPEKLILVMEFVDGGEMLGKLHSFIISIQNLSFK